MLFWTGSAAVENGSATVVVDTGAALTAEVARPYSMVALDGVIYFVESLTDTGTFEVTRPYAGDDGVVSLEIWPVSQDTTNLVNLAQIVSRTQAQINVLDKNSQGLFFNMKGVTGENDPGPGFIAFNNADPTAVTEAYVDVLDANGRNVAGLLSLWEPGTAIVVRSLTTTAYRAYTVATNMIESGWVSLALTYLGHDGVLADNEALGISWSSAAAGLEISATGSFADRDLYDDAPAGFVFLSTGGDLYRKNSATTGDWGPAVPFEGPQGAKGWTPVLGLANDGARRVIRLTDYVGGEGAKPTEGIGQYMAAGGLTQNIASAMDVRGVQGLSAYQVAIANGFIGAEPVWLTSLVGASAYEIAVANGFAGNQAAWLVSLIGANGTDPGALFNWDDGTTDADPGVGNMRADNVDLASASFLYVSKEGRTGDGLENFLISIGGSTNAVKGHVTLTSSGGNAQAVVGVESLTDAIGYVKIGLIGASHAGATGFVDATAVSLQFSRAGNQASIDAVSLASTINGAPNKTTPVAADVVLITDSEDGNVIKQVSLANLGQAISPPSGEVTAKTVNYTVLESDDGNVITVSASAAARTITLLPAVTAGNGFKLVIKKSDSSANAVTVDGNASETIDGALAKVLRLQGQSVALICDGANWHVMGEGTIFASGAGTGYRWTRYANGDQTCLGWAITQPSLSNASRGQIFGMSGSGTWTFPMEFADANVLVAGGAQGTSNVWVTAGIASTTTSCQYQVYSYMAMSSLQEIKLTAHGKWF